MDVEAIRCQLCSQLPSQLVDELLAAHEEAKSAFYLGGLRLTEVEGGRFCESAFRILEYITTDEFTPIGMQLNSDGLIRQLAQLPAREWSDSIRLHIPRSLRVMYDIRNKRDAAHLADGIDPNIQDSTLVCSLCDWVLAELIRLNHDIPPDEASEIVDGIVERRAPIVQDFEGFLKVLDPQLGASDYCLVLLYECGSRGANFEQLSEWIHPKMRSNLRRTLNRLVNDLAFVHEREGRYSITRAGQLDIESRQLLEPC